MLDVITVKDETMLDIARYALAEHYKKGNKTVVITTADKTTDLIQHLDAIKRDYRRYVSPFKRAKEFLFGGQETPDIWVLEAAEAQDAKPQKFVVRYPEHYDNETTTLELKNVDRCGAHTTIISSEPLMIY